MLRIGLALLLLTTPAMAQVAAGTAPAVGGSGNQPAPDVSSETSSAAPSRHPAVRRPVHNSAPKAARARQSDDTTR